MISIKIFLISIAILISTLLIFNYLEKLDLKFKIAVSFLLFGMLIIYVINQAVTLIETIDSSEAIDKIISSNYQIKLAQNAIILSIILSLIYGSYAEYRRSRKLVFIIIAFVLLVLTLLFAYMISSQL